MRHLLARPQWLRRARTGLLVCFVFPWSPAASAEVVVSTDVPGSVAHVPEHAWGTCPKGHLFLYEACHSTKVARKLIATKKREARKRKKGIKKLEAAFRRRGRKTFSRDTPERTAWLQRARFELGEARFQDFLNLAHWDLSGRKMAANRVPKRLKRIVEAVAGAERYFSRFRNDTDGWGLCGRLRSADLVRILVASLHSAPSPGLGPEIEATHRTQIALWVKKYQGAAIERYRAIVKSAGARKSKPEGPGALCFAAAEALLAQYETSRLAPEKRRAGAALAPPDLSGELGCAWVNSVVTRGRGLNPAFADATYQPYTGVDPGIPMQGLSWYGTSYFVPERNWECSLSWEPRPGAFTALLIARKTRETVMLGPMFGNERLKDVFGQTHQGTSDGATKTKLLFGGPTRLSDLIDLSLTKNASSFRCESKALHDGIRFAIATIAAGFSVTAHRNVRAHGNKKRRTVLSKGAKVARLVHDVEAGGIVRRLEASGSNVAFIDSIAHFILTGSAPRLIATEPLRDLCHGYLNFAEGPTPDKARYWRRHAAKVPPGELLDAAIARGATLRAIDDYLKFVETK